MSDEQISALIDDALPGDETRGAVDRLLRDDAARAAWGRYHLIGDALREAVHDGGLARRDAPAQDNVVPFSRPATPGVRPRTAVGMAAAAAVATLALALVALRPSTPEGSPPTVATAPSPEQGPRVANEVPPVSGGLVVVDEDGFVVPVNQQAIMEEAEREQRLNAYLMNFNERRARQAVPGLHTYVRSVDYEPR